jgi:predicted O-linked N-acetylglucosamine transferase (SPINDLY family)
MNIGQALESACQLQGQGKLDQAAHLYKEILKFQPDNVSVAYNLGIIYQDTSQLDEAVFYYRKAILLDPNLADAYFNLGLIFHQKGRLENALEAYEKALALDPDSADIHNNLGAVLKDRGQLDEAISSYRQALRINPRFADALNNLGNVLKDRGRLDEAISNYQQALRINPRFADALNNLGNVLKDRGRLEEAIGCYQQAVRINPGFADAFSNMGNAMKDRGGLKEAIACFRHAISINPAVSSVYSNLIFTMQYHPDYEARAIYEEHLGFARRYAESFASACAPHANKRDPLRRLRIGYLSPDFRKHAVSYFIEPVILAHNREQCEIFCYSNNLQHDEVTTRIRGYADQWRVIAGMSDEETAEQIRKDGIDILVDLAGHTADNRILVFARKPAPIQMSWIGYFATTGLSTMDYKIVDHFTDPEGKTEQFYTEKLLRLPESFLCYMPERESPGAVPLPALSKGHVTFGSLNNFCKITPEVFTLWTRILQELPDAHLLLKGKSFHDKRTSQGTIEMFSKRGVEAGRITLQPWDPSPKHLEAYNQIDIGLDTFPFNGATTTCEALWMGVPVITLEGTAYHARAGRSIMANVGLGDLVAGTPDEYISIALNLARDLKKLQSLHEDLRDMMICSPLCDAKIFTTNLEICYRQVWEKWCQSF